jgi:hypothetical protein
MIGPGSIATAGMGAPLSEPSTLPASSAVSTGGPIRHFLEWFGDLGIFFWQVLRAAVTPPFEFRELFHQLDEIGSKSLPLGGVGGRRDRHRSRPGKPVSA